MGGCVINVGCVYVFVWVCVWHRDHQTDKTEATKGGDRNGQKKGEEDLSPFPFFRLFSDSEAGWQRRSKWLTQGFRRRFADERGRDPTRRSPSLSIKNSSFIDRWENTMLQSLGPWSALVIWARVSPFPEPIKADNQIGTERWRLAAEFPTTGALQSFSSQRPKVGKLSFSCSGKRATPLSL